jgi:uncharacterized caspase-like protein
VQIIAAQKIAVALQSSGYGNDYSNFQEQMARALSQSNFNRFPVHSQVIRLGDIRQVASGLQAASQQGASILVLAQDIQAKKDSQNANRNEQRCTSRKPDANSLQKLFGADCASYSPVTVYCTKEAVRVSFNIEVLQTASGRNLSSQPVQAQAEHINCQPSESNPRPVQKSERNLLDEALAEAQRRVALAVSAQNRAIDMRVPAPDAVIAAAGLSDRYGVAQKFLQAASFERACADLADMLQRAGNSASLLQAMAICDAQYGQYEQSAKRMQQAESLLKAPDAQLSAAITAVRLAANTESFIKTSRPEYRSASAPIYASLVAPVAAAPAAVPATTPLAPAPIALPLSSGPRVALVIGNSAYQHVGALLNPRNDATDMRDALQRLGFQVIYQENSNRNQMIQAINRFGDALTPQTSALVFYAGHGMQVKGENYLMPIDANPKTEAEVEIEAVNLNRILAKIEKTNINIVVLDACRNDPFKRSWRSTGGTGLASVDAPKGTLIAYATSPGNVADDGTGRNSPYTRALLANMQQPNMRIEDVFKRVRAQVSGETSNRQVPWESSSLVGDFYFASASPATLAAPAAPTAPSPTPASPAIAPTPVQSAALPPAANTRTTTPSPTPAESAPASSAQADPSLLSPQEQCKDRTNVVSKNLCERRVCTRTPALKDKPECAAYTGAGAGTNPAQ